MAKHFIRGRASAPTSALPDAASLPRPYGARSSRVPVPRPPLKTHEENHIG